MPIPESTTLPLGDSVLTTSDPGDVFVLPTSLGQERFWGLDRLNPGNPAWSVPVRFRLQGALNHEFVERAFNEIVRRHESLRTTFTLVDGQPAQVIKPSLRIGMLFTDLRGLPKQERDVEVDRLSFEEARRRFNLAIGPLFRVCLMQVEDNEHVLLVTPHHSVADYWSIGLISNELGALYEALASGVDPVLPELSIQYGDFAVWQREQLNSTAVQDELAYWKKQLQDLPLPEIPTDHPRSDFPTYEATITSVLLPVKLTDAVRDFANRAGATFFNTMLAGLGIVLHHYTGQTDFGVATQVAGRNNVELEPLIGVFINNVILRLDLAGDPTFQQLVERVQETGLQALTKQGVRFEQVLKELRPRDYPSHHNLFRVNFICQRDPVKPMEFSGIKLTVIPSKCQGALYDLNVFLVLRNEGWRLACEYNTDLFEAKTITRLLTDYWKLLENIVEDSDRRVSQFPLSEGARQPGQHTKPDPLVTTSGKVMCASEEPTAYTMPTSPAQRRFWVLEEFAPGNPALHMRACVRLTGPLSIPALEKSIQGLVHRHETLRTTFETTDEEIIQVIAPSAAISMPVTLLQDIAEADREKSLWAAIRVETSAAFDLVRGPLIRARLFRLQPEEHVLVITTHHILADGWSQNVIQRELWTIYEALAEGRQPSLPQLPVQYGDFVHWQQQWLASDDAQDQINFWKKQLAPPLPVLNFPAGRPARQQASSQGPMETLLLPGDLVRSLKSLAQSHDATMFMVMLTGYCALLNRYTSQDDILIGSPVANRKPETEPLIGPFAGPVALRLDLSGNPTLRELLGRVRDVTLEALSHADVPFEALLEQLNVRSVHGRKPLSQCYFFYQVAFLQPRQLRELTVTPLPDIGLGTHFELQMGLLDRGEGLRAQLEYNPELFEPATIKDILNSYQAVLHVLATYPYARLSDIPVSVMAKSEPHPERAWPQAEVTLPRDETEKQLTQIWEELLNVRPIGPRNNYFELGGSSLLAARLFSRIEKIFDVRLPLSTLIEAQTIEDLARILRGNGTVPSWSPLVKIQTGGSRPRFFCVHGGGGNVLIYRDLARHLGPDQPFYGLQSQGLDGQQPLLDRIEDMAALYLRHIRKVQPHGPYFLGGYCMGGTVALEMAQQLKAQGEDVALLALFDTLNWSKLSPNTVRRKTCYEAQRLLFHAQNFLLLNFRDKFNFLRAKLHVLRGRLRVWRGMLLGPLTRKQYGASPESLLLAKIWRTNDRAGLAYVPLPYSGTITDFRPMQQYARYNEPGVHWEDLIMRRHTIVTLPVYPAGMLLEPFVKDLAAGLASAIDQAMQASLANAPSVPLPTTPTSSENTVAVVRFDLPHYAANSHNTQTQSST